LSSIHAMQSLKLSYYHTQEFMNVNCVGLAGNMAADLEAKQRVLGNLESGS
jgi:hypothetical protein